MRRAMRLALAWCAMTLGASALARGARIGPERAARGGDRGEEGGGERPSTRVDGADARAPRDRAIEFDRIERVSWRPHAEVYRGFLTREECDHLKALATPSLGRSTVVDASNGGSVPSDIRTSSGMFLLRGEDDVVASIERRIASWTHVPESHGEGFQVLRYEFGQEYRPHFDYFQDEFNQKREKGGQRVATVLMYLTDVEEGGETIFPDAEAGANPGGGDDASSCAAGKLFGDKFRDAFGVDEEDAWARQSKARIGLFSPGGPLAQQLSMHHTVLIVNDTVFAHGGLVPRHVEFGLDKLNRAVTDWMRGKEIKDDETRQALGMAIGGVRDSIVWHRAYGTEKFATDEDRSTSCELLGKTLGMIDGVSRLVVGHTPQLGGANCECNGQIWRIDVGMSFGVLGAEPQVLEIDGDEVRVLSSSSVREKTKA